jgi:23S rRNA pseudouridine955/2504/2580 synthase/23S rRNA pseudouridine1911/1915/1917 synthase
MRTIVFKDPKFGKQSVDIIYEDDDLLISNKPPHLPVIPDRFEGRYNLRDLINKFRQKEKANKIWVVHRIDADTSGLVMFTKSEHMHREINSLFEDRKIEKYYLAVVEGVLKQKEGIIDRPILKTARRMLIDKKGKPSQTFYNVIEQFDGFSLLQLKPLTGRTHQIRVHLKDIGCPLAVDPLYGKRSEIGLNHLKNNYHSKPFETPRPLCARLTLHAHQLKFIDPRTGQTQQFEAELPKDLMALIKALKKYKAG